MLRAFLLTCIFSTHEVLISVLYVMNWGIILCVKRVSGIGPDRHEEGAEGLGLFFVTAASGVVVVGLGWEMAGTAWNAFPKYPPLT